MCICRTYRNSPICQLKINASHYEAGRNHIEGGEISGTIDELIRHAVTKLSHIHFVSNEEAKERLIQMGECQESIFVIGSPDIEVMKSETLPSLSEVKERYEIPFDEYAVLIFHPVVTELNTLKSQVEILILSLIESKRNYVVIYPNNDKGSNIILNEYEKLKNNNNFKIYPSLRFEYFLTLLKNSKFIIGNSSAGIREAEVYGVPAVNFGTRQKNRSKNEKIKNVNSDKKSILDAIQEAETKKITPISHFGFESKSSKRFFQILKEESIWNVSLQKQFVDLNVKSEK